MISGLETEALAGLREVAGKRALTTPKHIVSYV